MIGRIRGPFCGFFDGRKAKRTRKGLDREARKEERKAKPTLSHGYHPPNGQRGGKILAWRFALFFFRNEKRLTDTSMTGGASAQLK